MNLPEVRQRVVFEIVVRGYQRVKVQRYEDNEFFLALPDNIDDQIDIDAPTQKALLGSLKELSKEVLASLMGEYRPNC